MSWSPFTPAELERMRNDTEELFAASRRRQHAVPDALTAMNPTRPLCNCRRSYKDQCETIACSAAECTAKDDIAQAYLALLRGGPEPPDSAIKL